MEVHHIAAVRIVHLGGFPLQSLQISVFIPAILRQRGKWLGSYTKRQRLSPVGPCYEICRLLPQLRSPGLEGKTDAENDSESQSLCMKQAKVFAGNKWKTGLGEA